MKQEHEGLLMKGFAVTSFVFVFVVTPYLTAGPQHASKQGTVKKCMDLLQQTAKSYAEKNEGKYPVSCRSLIPGMCKEYKSGSALPETPFSESTDYIFDLPGTAVDEMLDGDVHSLKSLARPAQIGYGPSSNRKNFVVVGFDDIENKAEPLAAGRQPIFMLTADGMYCGKFRNADELIKTW